MRLTKQLTSELKDEEGSRAVIARISTTSVDRDGDVMLPSGVDLTDFRKNPVVLFGHDQSTLPIGKATVVERETNAVVAKVHFAERPAAHPDAAEWVPDTVLDLFKQGVLRAFSVGFQIPEGGARVANKRDGSRFGDGVRRIITRWKLLEFSVVPVPANQDALAVAVSKGIIKRDSWTWGELQDHPQTYTMNETDVDTYEQTSKDTQSVVTVAPFRVFPPAPWRFDKVTSDK